jgi:hypothetical protein
MGDRRDTECGSAIGRRVVPADDHAGRLVLSPGDADGRDPDLALAEGHVRTFAGAHVNLPRPADP